MLRQESGEKFETVSGKENRMTAAASAKPAGGYYTLAVSTAPANAAKVLTPDRGGKSRQSASGKGQRSLAIHWRGV
jgi:hypothetical protein